MQRKKRGYMTDKELEAYIKDFKRFVENFECTPEEAKVLAKAAGVLDENGNIKKRWDTVLDVKPREKKNGNRN